LKANWRDPHANDLDLPFALAVFRRGLNLPKSAEQLGYPIPWDPAKFKEIAAMGKFYNTDAYRMQVGHQKRHGGFHGTQAEMLLHYVFNPLWGRREIMRVRPDDTCRSYCDRLGSIKWMGGWYAYRVTIDLKYTPQLAYASDWWTHILLGPGTVRGLNRLVGRPVNHGIHHNNGVLITASQEEQEQMIRDIQQLRGPLSAQVFGGALCEWDKYERIRQSEGSVRVRKYPRSNSIKAVGAQV
jgi:hypothetical protein